MKAYFLMGVLALSAPVALTGCDKQVAETTKETSGPNGTKTETKEVTQSPSGTVTEKKTETNNTTAPNP